MLIASIGKTFVGKLHQRMNSRTILSLCLILFALLFAGGCSSTGDICDGCFYEGETLNEKRHGKGTFVWPYGDVYTGEFRNGKMHGTGTYTWKDGRIYVGEFRSDKINGKGTLTYENGDQYVGEFKNEFWYGQGTFTFANGDTESGQWKHDKFVSGVIEKLNPDTGLTTKEWVGKASLVEKVYTGTMKNGKSHGQGTLDIIDMNNGKVAERYSGQWENDVIRSGTHEKFQVDTDIVIFRFNGTFNTDGSYAKGKTESLDASGSIGNSQNVP